MMLSVPEAVRASLSWLDFSADQERVIDYIYSTSLMVKGFGGDEDIISGIHGCWLSAYETSNSIGANWVEFIEEYLFTLEELVLLVSDKSPYYGLSVKSKLTQSERFCYLMNDVSEGRWAPLKMRQIWARELSAHGGNALAAEVSLAFLKPESEIAERVTS